MRRRGAAVEPEPIPDHLATFVAPDWGWEGPHYRDGYLVDGLHEAELGWHAARHAWMEEHPKFDWLADILKRCPDAPRSPA